MYEEAHRQEVVIPAPDYEWSPGTPFKYARSPIKWRDPKMHLVRATYPSGRVDVACPTGSAYNGDLFEYLPAGCYPCQNCVEQIAFEVEKEAQRRNPQPTRLTSRSLQTLKRLQTA